MGKTKQRVGDSITIDDLSSSELEERIGEEAAATLREEIKLIQGVYPKFDKEAYPSGSDLPSVFWLCFE